MTRAADDFETIARRRQEIATSQTCETVGSLAQSEGRLAGLLESLEKQILEAFYIPAHRLGCRHGHIADKGNGWHCADCGVPISALFP